tara:strand:+ start:1475 stop:2209 length:735 start_codon:yes stop_codon:yes gene_type:complete
MKKYKNIIDCIKYDSKSYRNTPFSVAKYVFNYESNVEDRNLLNNIINSGNQLAQKVNPSAANNGKKFRNAETILNNSISGLLAEYIWIDFIEHHNIKCHTNDFQEAKNQIDIELTHNKKKIEVRSSFPRNGLEFALCDKKYQFDVIGPYINDYKPDELKKDFYVRTLFPFRSIELKQKIKSDNFTVYLTGGATWEMMIDKDISIQKNFIPEDELNPERIGESSVYKVIPFSRALETFEIIKKFK